MAENLSVKGGLAMYYFAELVVAVMGAVAAHYIIKWLNSDNDKNDS